jgi:hypothetical protein
VGFFWMACSVTCFAQTQTTARITGTVRDTTNAVLINAQVVAQNSATGEERRAITNSSGDYVLTSLLPGVLSGSRENAGMLPGISTFADSSQGT